jgi:nicotinate-nucleotide adenylyltransferase
MGLYIDSEAQLRRCAGRPVALYSGSFNPPHLGHLALMEAVLARGLVEQVLVFPHSLNVGKRHDLVAIDHRVNMLRLLLAGSPRAAALHICDPDFCHGFHDHVAYLAECLGGERYVAILIGSDSLCRDDYPADLLRYRHLVHLRRDTGPVTLPVGINADSVMLRGIHCLSSTEVRARPAAEWVSLVGEAVADYVRVNGLYR